MHLYVDAPQSDEGEDIKMKENEVYGVSMVTIPGQPQTQDSTLMSTNVCYATTQQVEIVGNECYGSATQDIEIVSNECYGCVPEKH